MNNLKIKEFNPSILNNATLICNGSGFMKTYNLNNGFIFKMVKDDTEHTYSQLREKDDFLECLYGKLLLSKYLDSESLVLPRIIYMKKDQLFGYTVPCINMKSFDDIIANSDDINYILAAFLRLSSLVREHNKNGINFPDLGNTSNIFMNPKNLDIKFIDYDGLQIDDYDSFSVSKIMNTFSNPIFLSKKYFNRSKCLFSSNFDKAALLTLFLYYTTGTVLTKFNGNSFDKKNGKYLIKDEELTSYLESLGLLDTSIDSSVREVYSSHNNKYPDTSIKRLVKEYKWGSSSLSFNKK